MKKIRLGIIGAGSWALSSHLPNLLKYEDIEFVGISRKGSDNLVRIKDRYGFQVASEDYRDVLSAGIDICVVATPVSMHYEHAKAALESGAHVLCEKPVTISPEEAWDLDAVARSVNRTLTIAFGWNYMPLVVSAKNLMEKYGIGNLEQFSINMSSATRELLSNSGSYPDADKESPPETKTWTDKSISGGGYGQAQLSHAFGLAFLLVNARADSAFAMMSNPGGAPVELHNAITYRLDNGAIGTVSGGSAHADAAKKFHALQLRAIGDDGQLLVDLERAAVWLFHKGKNYNVKLDDDAGAYNCQGPIEVLVAAGRGAQILNYSDGNLGARTVEALDLAYRSANSGELVTR